MSRPVDAVIEAARGFMGERITTNAGLRDHHSHGQDTQTPVQPDAVAFVETTEEASKLMVLCHAHGVPVVPFGTGTSLEGHVTPVRGGISLDLSKMAAVLEVNAPDMDCRVQAGVTHRSLNTYLRDQGLFFPVDPGADASLGGMCATRASGTAAVRYGTIRENVLGLTVVLADGRVIKTGGRARHDAYWAALALKPGHQGIATDAIVPISRLAEAILGAQADIKASGLTAPIVGHVGDGNFHTVILVPPEEGGLDRAWELDKKIVARALALGGSCSGEHGVGLGKREFLEAEVGAEALAVMRGVKASLDPKGILNPGKIFLN